MKNLILALSILIGFTASASDQIMSEVICEEAILPGSADSGLTFILSSNPTAWVKTVTVIENGYTGPQQIAQIQVPLQPVIEGGGNGYIPTVNLVYKGAGLVLSLVATDIKNHPLNGKGMANLNLPGSIERSDIQLICQESF